MNAAVVALWFQSKAGLRCDFKAGTCVARNGRARSLGIG